MVKMKTNQKQMEHKFLFSKSLFINHYFNLQHFSPQYSTGDQVSQRFVILPVAFSSVPVMFLCLGLTQVVLSR